jgi:hypothetical protein
MRATPNAGRLQLVVFFVMVTALLYLCPCLWLCIGSVCIGASGASAAWLRVGLVDERGI